MITVDKIKARRAAAGLSMAQSAAVVHVKPLTWRRWETGGVTMPVGLYALYCLRTGQAAYAPSPGTAPRPYKKSILPTE